MTDDSGSAEPESRRSGTRRGLVPAVIVVVVVAIVVGLAAALTSSGPERVAEPVPEPPPRQVHLGDSFAAGTGITPLVEDSPFTCQRSEENFGRLIARRNGYALTDVSCAGAWTGSLYEAQYEGVAPQLDAVTPDTDVVTMMLGGNDDGLYSTLVGDCRKAAATDPTGAPCRAELGMGPVRSISREIRPAVERALRDIRARAPRATVLIAGYPWLAPQRRSCRPALALADGDIGYVRRMQARLNAAIASAARAAGAVFVDMAGQSTGHDPCRPAGTRWIEPMVGSDAPIVMHPNADGQRALADAVAATLAGRR